MGLEIFKFLGIKSKNQIKSDEDKDTKDKLFSSLKKYDTEKEAKEAFLVSKSKLFNINMWSKLPGITSSFSLHDSNGNKKKANPKIGDYILIKLPGPLPENWVIIVDLVDTSTLSQIIVSPSSKPKAKGHEKNEIEHFFIDEATSTFRITREGDTLFAFEIGKDEGINNEGQKAANRELINSLIAQGGWAGFQKLQWEKLTDYLVHKIEIKT
jgi:hypothetical protein